MKNKRLIITTLVMILLATMAIPTFAQGGNPPRQNQYQDQILLEALGITIDELHDRLDAGETIEELYAEAGLEMPTFREVMIARGRSGFVQLADALGITVDDLEARIDAGEPIADLYAEAGIEMPAAYSEVGQLLSSLDITADELRDLLQNGTSIQELYEQAGLELPVLFKNSPYADLAEALGITTEELNNQIHDFFQGLYDEAGLEMPENIGNGTFGNPNGAMPQKMPNNKMPNGAVPNPMGGGRGPKNSTTPVETTEE